MLKIREEIGWKEERFRLLSDKVDKNIMEDAEMEAELQGLQAGEERRGSNASQAVDCCLETVVEQIFAMGTDQARSKFNAMCQVFFKRFETFALLRRCPEEKKEEETVKMNKSKVEPVSSWCYQRQAGSNKVHWRVVWNLIFILSGVYLVKAEVQEDQANKEITREVHPDHQDGILWMRKRMTMWEEWCLKQKRKKNSHEMDPRTFEENSQGRDPSTLERKSQGKDPRTLAENFDGGSVGSSQINSQREDPRTWEAPVKRWRAQKKRREKKWKRKKKKKKKKKQVKHTISFWWTERKEQVSSFFVSERKEEDVKEKGRKRSKSPRAKQVLGKSGRWLFLLLILMQHWLCVDAAAEAGAKRGSGGAEDHYRVGCGQRHQNGPGWQKPSQGADGRASEKVEVVRRN